MQLGKLVTLAHRCEIEGEWLTVSIFEPLDVLGVPQQALTG